MSPVAGAYLVIRLHELEVRRDQIIPVLNALEGRGLLRIRERKIALRLAGMLAVVGTEDVLILVERPGDEPIVADLKRGARIELGSDVIVARTRRIPIPSQAKNRLIA